MSAIPTKVARDLVQSADFNHVLTALFAEHLNNAGHEHANIIKLGEALADADRTIIANLLLGQRWIEWNQANLRWEFSNDGVTGLPIGSAAGDPNIFIAPPYPNGTSVLSPTAPTTIPPRFEDIFDTSESLMHGAAELDNLDSVTTTAITNIRWRVPTGFTPTELKVFHKRVGSGGATGLTVALFGTDNAAATLGGAQPLQSATWAEATLTITAGVFTAGGYATLRLTHSAVAGEKQRSGEILIVGTL